LRERLQYAGIDDPDMVIKRAPKTHPRLRLFKKTFLQKRPKKLVDRRTQNEEHLTGFQAHHSIVAAEFLRPCCGGEQRCAAGL
jgi:hypothetical protein